MSLDPRAWVGAAVAFMASPEHLVGPCVVALLGSALQQGSSEVLLHGAARLPLRMGAAPSPFPAPVFVLHRGPTLLCPQQCDLCFFLLYCQL